MTKADLVDQVAKNNSFTKKEAEVVVETVLETIKEALKDGKGVELRGFGSFRLRERAGRQGRNPKTGDVVQVPSKRVAYFKLGKQLKILINS